MTEPDFRIRVNEALKNCKVSLRSLCENENSYRKIQRQIRENSTISLDVIDAVLTAIPDLSAEWLLRGEGSMLRSASTSTTNNPTTIHRQSAHNLHNGTGDINDGVSSSDSDALKVAMEALKQNAELIQLLSQKHK